jgi:hypothetical protein
MGVPSFITSTCVSLVAFLHTMDPPLGACTGLGLNAPLPAELTMFTVVVIGAEGDAEGAVGVEVLTPPPPLPPHASADREPDAMIARRVLFMNGVRRKADAAQNANKQVTHSKWRRRLLRVA